MSQHQQPRLVRTSHKDLIKSVRKVMMKQKEFWSFNSGGRQMECELKKKDAKLRPVAAVEQEST
jgi:hypothetical protein